MTKFGEDQNIYCTSLGSLSKDSIVATGDISAVIDRKAALVSPEFEGQPLVPDPTSESQPGQIANIGYVNKAVDGKRDKTDLAVYEQADYWEGTSTSGTTVNLPLVSSSGYSKTYSNGSTDGCYQLQADDYRTIGGVFRVYLRVNRSEMWATVSIAPETSFDEITEVTTKTASPAYTFKHHAEAVPEQDNFLATTNGMAELLDGKVDKGGETDPLFTTWKDSKRIAVGNNAGTYTDGAISIGNSTNATGGGAVAIGSGAKSEASGAVEIGAGTNSTQNSLAFRGFPLAEMTTSGTNTICKIPNERLSVDATLSTSGAPADAKAVGEQIAAAKNKADQSLVEVGQINDLIPTQASTENQLADKNFVNSSIATNTATFRGTSDAATLADFNAWLATLPADNNDYVFWRTVDSEGNTVYKRYKYNDDSSDLSGEPLAGHWLFEYELNNSSFTAEQWAAINSGITSGAAAKLDALPTAEALAQSLAGKMPSTATGADIAVSGSDATKISDALAGKEDASNKVTSLTAQSTDTQYPSAKCVYDALQGVDTKPTRIYNDAGTDALDDKGQLFKSSIPGASKFLVTKDGTTSEWPFYRYQSEDNAFNGHSVYSYGTWFTDLVCYDPEDGVVGFTHFDTEHYIRNTYVWDVRVPKDLDPGTIGTVLFSGTLSDMQFGEDDFRDVAWAARVPTVEPDSYARFAIEAMPTAWAASTTYMVGVCASYDGKAYRCKTEHTSGSTFDTSKWDEIPVLSQKADKPSAYADGNLTKFDSEGNPVDSQIPAANVAVKSDLRYSLVTKTITDGAVTLADRADNYVDARALGSSDSVDIDFPALVDGKARDFMLAVECGANPPSISYAALVTIMAEDASSLTLEEGMNIYSFKEFKTNMFIASRKLVATVVDNSSENS